MSVLSVDLSGLMREHPLQITRPILKYASEGWQPVEGRVIEENPVSLTVNGQVWLTFMCSPDQLEALAAGFLFNEGVIHHRDEIIQVRVCENQANVDIWLSHPAEQPKTWQRASGCTGGVTNPAAVLNIHPVAQQNVFTPAQLLAGMDQLYQVEGLYQQNRGLHNSALFDGQEIRCHAADIGRHNTVDKLAGQLLLNSKGDQISPRLVLTTGRISSEMLQKSARLGAEVVISRTSPTRMAVRLAEDLGITLVGYARKTEFIVYTWPDRVIGAFL